MANKGGMTPDELAKMAAELVTMDEALVRHYIAVSGKYPKASSSRFRRAVDTSRLRLIRVRLALEDLACKTLGEDSGMSLIKESEMAARAQLRKVV